MTALPHLEASQAVRHHGVDGRAPQQPCDVAIIMPTVLRPSLERAVATIYGQRFDGTIQLMVGIDGGRENIGRLERLIAARPPHVAVTVVDPGYSTCVLRGGFHGAFDGGALRTILSYTANSPLLANLDDDNWWADNHLATLTAAIEGKAWAFSERWFVAPDGETVLHRDIWESRGPGEGTYVPRWGGFADTNTMLIDKRRAEHVLRLWAIPLEGEEATGIGSDSHVFTALKELPWGKTGEATVYYVLDRGDHMFPRRARRIRRQISASFDGFDAYCRGDFAVAAENFRRLIAINGGSAVGLAWLELCRRRAGQPPASVHSRSGEPVSGRVWAVFEGGEEPGDLDRLEAKEAGALAFFAGTRALLQGDRDKARHWLKQAVARGRPEGSEMRAARADLARLDGLSPAPSGPRSSP